MMSNMQKALAAARADLDAKTAHLSDDEWAQEVVQLVDGLRRAELRDEYLHWDQPCEKDVCGWRCWRDYPTDDHFTKDVSIYYGDAGTVDGEGPCNCDHHEEYTGPQEGPQQ